METFRCPTCLTVLAEVTTRRCPTCHSRLRGRRRRPIVLGEGTRTGAKLSRVELMMLDRLEATRGPNPSHDIFAAAPPSASDRFTEPATDTPAIEAWIDEAADTEAATPSDAPVAEAPVAEAATAAVRVEPATRELFGELYRNARDELDDEPIRARGWKPAFISRRNAADAGSDA